MEIAIIIIVCHNGNTMRQLPRELYIDWNVDIANVAAKNTKNNKQKEMVRTRKTLKKIISRIVFGSGRCWWQKELAYYDLLINDVIRTVRLKKKEEVIWPAFSIAAIDWRPLAVQWQIP